MNHFIYYSLLFIGLTAFLTIEGYDKEVDFENTEKYTPFYHS